MKEFSNNMVIQFEHNGKTIRQRIDTDKIERNGKLWLYRFWRNGHQFLVSGDIDTDGDFRTSGPVTKSGRLSRFLINVDGLVINDIDIVGVDVPMVPGRMYITVQVDYEREETANDGEVRQEIMAEADYRFSVGSNLPFRICETQILGESI